jgi:acyl-coenzyme A synthetase/AMP-(fatty) acid ligase
MSIPLSFVSTLASPRAGTSLGDHLAEQVTDSGKINTLLDCLCSTSEPAIHSPDQSRPPLRHCDIHDFVAKFALPYRASRGPLGPNDRVMVVLPTGPENALALLALASYHTCAPLNASCTATELMDDADRLRAKAIIATRESEQRLDLRRLRDQLQCEVVYVEPRFSGPAGLFDMSLLGSSSSLALDDEKRREPSQLHRLHDQSLVLHTSGTSGKKKVVPYTLRSLIVGTCAVALSWELKPSDVNSEYYIRFMYNI